MCFTPQTAGEYEIQSQARRPLSSTESLVVEEYVITVSVLAEPRIEAMLDVPQYARCGKRFRVEAVSSSSVGDVLWTMEEMPEGSNARIYFDTRFSSDIEFEEQKHCAQAAIAALTGRPST